MEMFEGPDVDPEPPKRINDPRRLAPHAQRRQPIVAGPLAGLPVLAGGPVPFSKDQVSLGPGRRVPDVTLLGGAGRPIMAGSQELASPALGPPPPRAGVRAGWARVLERR